MDGENPPTWMLSVDDAFNLKGSGVGVVLEGSNDLIIKQSFKFKFKASNNQAEYKTLIIDMTLTLEVHVSRLKANSDSQLVANQVSVEYQTNLPHLVKYLKKV